VTRIIRVYIIYFTKLLIFLEEHTSIRNKRNKQQVQISKTKFQSNALEYDSVENNSIKSLNSLECRLRSYTFLYISIVIVEQ
jgi:hypothetical protein